MSTDLEAAWSDLHDAKPEGWFVGSPAYNERYKEWEQYALRPVGAGCGRRPVA